MVRLICHFGSFALLVLLAGKAMAGATQTHPPDVGWELERDVQTPTRAVTAPVGANLNIDSFVLSCEQGPSRRGLQLRLNLLEAGPLVVVALRPLPSEAFLDRLQFGQR